MTNTKAPADGIRYNECEICGDAHGLIERGLVAYNNGRVDAHRDCAEARRERMIATFGPTKYDPAPAAEETTTITTRPATDAEKAADAHKPAHKQVATVETDTDGRATVGRAKTVHRATVVRNLNAYGESIGSTVTVECGAVRYRNNHSFAARPNRAPKGEAITCSKCLGH